MLLLMDGVVVADARSTTRRLDGRDGIRPAYGARVLFLYNTIIIIWYIITLYMRNTH